MSGDRETVEEHIYTVPLNRAWIKPKKKRAPRAVRILREFVKKNTAAEKVIINSEVNEKLWSKGIEGSPRQIRIKTVKDRENTVTVYLVKGE